MLQNDPLLGLEKYVLFGIKPFNIGKILVKSGRV